jgi:hypothetical protein
MIIRETFLFAMKTSKLITMSLHRDNMREEVAKHEKVRNRL